MNALTRFERFDDLLPELFRRFAQPLRLADGLPEDIRLDLSETDKQYEVRAEIPGARKEDIQVDVHDNLVSISAEIRREKEERQGLRMLVKETTSGRISRSFSLLHEVDAGQVTARLEDGLLKLVLPKREGSGARKIEIR
jgi:HSP20 family protein